MKFSIITISLNSAEYVEQAIQCVLDQNYDNFEHIIIDGGSTDGTINILRKYEHLIWISEPDEGRAHAVNKGMRLMSGDVCGWLNTDDMYLPGVFELCNQYFQSHSDVHAIYGGCQYIDVEGRIVGQSMPGPFDLRRLILSGDSYTPHVSTFVRTSVFERIGLMDESMPTSYDRDMIIRIGKHFRVANVSRHLGCFRMHSKSVTAFDPYPAVEENKRITERHWRGRRIERFVWENYWRLRKALYLRIKRNPMLKKARMAEAGKK